MTIRNQFKVFEENSSSEDAIAQFASGELTFSELEEAMWDKRAKVVVRRLKRLGRPKALSVCRRWCTSKGYDYRCPHCGRC